MDEIIKNVSLFSFSIAIVAIGILGFLVFSNNRKSITNRLFFLFTLITLIWSALNYLSFQFYSENLTLFILRLVIFFGVWHSFAIFLMFYAFPSEKINISKKIKFILLPLLIIISGFTLTPLVLNRIGEMSPAGGALKAINGPVMPIFGVTVLGLIISGFLIFIKKMRIIKDELERKKFKLVFVGASSFFLFLLIFNFILPAFFDISFFIKLSAVFIFPFIGFTAYAIYKHQLFNIKVIATELLTFVIWIAVLIEVLLADTWGERLAGAGLFIFIIIFGIFLIKSVKKEVSQREKIEKLAQELKSANEKLTELDKLKSGMFSFVSHQIKAPIGIVKGFAQLLYDGSYGELPEKAKETVGTIKKAAERLIELVENFLDLRRIEEGKIDYKFEEINIVDLAKEVVEELKLLAEQKHLELTFSSEAEEIKVKADEQRMHQVIQNLIENAIKYTEKGFVKVGCRMSDVDGQKSVLISVEDTGMGIAEDALPTIFDQFSRAQAARTIKGTGLGLYIAKEIVKAHNGEIWAESDGEGKGSRFYVKLTR